LSSAKQEMLFLGKPEQVDRDVGWLNSNSEEHGLQEVGIVNLIGQYDTLAGPGMMLSHR
jgi:hypothetical protein